MLWILLPLIAGYCGARQLPAVNPLWLALAGMLILAASLLRAMRGPGEKESRTAAWGLTLSLTIFLGAWAWWQVRVPEMPPAWEELPARETDLRLKVISSFAPPPDGRYWRGTGRITEVQPLVAELVGQTVVFSTRAPEQATPLTPGRKLFLRGVVRRLEDDPDNAFLQYCKSQHIYFRLNQGWLLEEPAPPTWLSAKLNAAREHWSAILRRAPAGQESRADVLAAMLLGDRALLDPDQEEAFLLSGTMHLFAVSGLHVVAVAGTLLGLTTLLRFPRRSRGPFTLLLLGVYVLVIGMPSSAVRAYAMLAFYGAGRTLDRRTASFPAIIASAVAVLLWDPRELIKLGFQLSYAVVASILLLGLPLGDALEKRFRPGDPLAGLRTHRLWNGWNLLRRTSIQALSISLAATLASAPLIILHFEVFTPGAIVINPVLMPVAALVVVDGIIVLLTGLLHLDAISLFFAHAGWLLIALMEFAIGASLHAPGLFDRRSWILPGAAETFTILFLLLGLLAHHRAIARQWPAAVRFGLPIIAVLLGLWTGTRAAG